MRVRVYRFKSCLWRGRRHHWLPEIHDGPYLYDYCRRCPAWRWRPQ